MADLIPLWLTLVVPRLAGGLYGKLLRPNAGPTLAPAVPRSLGFALRVNAGVPQERRNGCRVRASWRASRAVVL